MKFIMFCGDDRVGKSTMSRSLQSLIHRGFRVKTSIVSFADGVRDELVNLYGIPNEIIYNKTIDKKKLNLCLGDYTYEGIIPQLWMKYGLIGKLSDYSDIEISLRDLFVTHGTKIRRQEDDLYWNKIVKEKVASFDDIEICIIDDPRSPSDFEFDTLIFHLNNNQPAHYNLEQQRFHDWLKNNEHRIDLSVDLPVHLLEFDADKINKQIILPYIRDKMIIK